MKNYRAGAILVILLLVLFCALVVVCKMSGIGLLDALEITFS